MSNTLTERGDPAFLDQVRGDLLRNSIAGIHVGELVTIAGLKLYAKQSPLRGKASLRHAIKSCLPGIHIPRLQEFDNLSWLRRNGFGAPRPVAAGAIYRHHLPVFQFLYTEWVPDSPTLRTFCESGAPDDRRSILEELGREVARLHSRGFTHRDLFPRNILVSGLPCTPAIVFLDAWRGGPRRGLRGPNYDLACLTLDADQLFGTVCKELLFDVYFEQSVELGRVLNRAGVLRMVERERIGLARRLMRSVDFASRS